MTERDFDECAHPAPVPAERPQRAGHGAFRAFAHPTGTSPVHPHGEEPFAASRTMVARDSSASSFRDARAALLSVRARRAIKPVRAAPPTFGDAPKPHSFILSIEVRPTVRGIMARLAVMTYCHLPLRRRVPPLLSSSARKATFPVLLGSQKLPTTASAEKSGPAFAACRRDVSRPARRLPLLIEIQCGVYVIESHTPPCYR